MGGIAIQPLAGVKLGRNQLGALRDFGIRPESVPEDCSREVTEEEWGLFYGSGEVNCGMPGPCLTLLFHDVETNLVIAGHFLASDVQGAEYQKMLSFVEAFFGSGKLKAYVAGLSDSPEIEEDLDELLELRSSVLRDIERIGIEVTDTSVTWSTSSLCYGWKLDLKQKNATSHELEASDFSLGFDNY